MDIALIGFDIEIIDLIESSPKYNFYGFIDKHNVAQQFGWDNIKYLGTDEARKKILTRNNTLNFAIGMNRPEIREKMFNLYTPKNIATLKSHLSYISSRSVIGKGSVIQHHVSIMPGVKIGHGCLVHMNATIHHESVLGNFSIMAPGSILLGRVIVEDQVYIGAGAIVKENCKIGSGAVVGAGAIVVHDIPKNSTVVGIPAKNI